MTTLADIITANEQETLGRSLRESGFPETADLIDQLVKFATEEIYLVDELDRALRNYITAEQHMHQTYGSTAACSGGIGGAALTAHCAHVCHNFPAHTDETAEWREAVLAAHEAIEKVRNA